MRRLMRKSSLILLSGLAAALFSCTRELDTPASPEPETCTVTATFEDGADEPDTRTTLTMNDAGTRASVTWNRGDQFRMFELRSNAYYMSDFTANASGSLVSFTGQKPIYDGSGPYYCCYPSRKADGVWTVSGKPVLIVTVPDTQAAVAGGVADGLNISVAYTTSTDASIRFRNILCYIRFRLSGEAVSEVASITLDAGKSVAGTATVYDVPTGGANARFDINWNDAAPSSSKVRLTGPFVAGQDYFIALAPVTMQGFSLLFEDAEGHRIRKRSTMNLACQRSKIYDFGTIGIGDSFPTEETGEAVLKYRTASAGQRPVTVCVISEGFTKAQLGDYVDLAGSAIDFLLDTEPYKTYKDFFNVYILSVPSEESGASVTDGNGNITRQVDSYFGARWGSSTYLDMVADENTVYDYVSRHCPDILDGTHTIDEVMVAMIINDPRYGGINHTWSTGRAYSMVPYTDSGGPISWPFPNLTASTDDPLPNSGAMSQNYHWTSDAERDEMVRSMGDWRNTLVHEFGGHAFGRLGDEYWAESSLSFIQSQMIDRHYWTPVPFALNLSASATDVPWGLTLLDRRDELVSRNPLYARIGVYQGGDGYLFGRWRSEKVSCMIDNRPYFSTWQRYLIVKRIKELAGESFTWSSFINNDVPADPLRDGSAKGMAATRSGVTPREAQPCPPPVFHEGPRPLPRSR